MFKSVRRRSEKNKIKAVFKLQFHATQLTQLVGDSLMISVIPDDIGKPTIQLEKAKVQDGGCYWEKPLYETVMFSHDPKTGKIREKIYHFVVATGFSKSGVVGEVSIDFASYAEATKISSLSLPLKNANSSPIFYVSIQRVQGGFDQREVDQSENASYKDRSLRAYFGYPTEDHESSSGSDITPSSSNSSSGLDTPRKHEPKSTNPTHISLTTNKSQSQSQADLLELELQTLRKQIVKEQQENQDLSREVKVNGMLLIDEGDPWALISELRQELNREKDLSSNLRCQLQEKSKSKSKSMLKSKSKTDDDEDQRALEMIVREHNGVKEAYLLEQKLIDLYSEIEFYKRDKDDLEMQMDQIALDYEILKQENHDLRYKMERFRLQEQLKVSYEHETQIENLENELKTTSKELSKAILTINELETRVEELMNAKNEQEQRTIHAEDNLRKIRLQNANAAERLQEELRRLSMKMAYTFEANEKAAMEAMNEANKLRVGKRALEDMFVNVKERLRFLGDFYEEKLVGLSDQITFKSKQLEKMKKRIEDMIRQHERERLKEIGFDSSENVFLEKEKDLRLEIEEFERRLDDLVQKTENSQISKAKNSKPRDEKNPLSSIIIPCDVHVSC